MARSTTQFCARCGAVLRDGVCPRGHPQRAMRHRTRRRRRVLPWIVAILILGALGAGAYAGLVVYPARSAEDLMGPSSAEFDEALAAYRQAVAAFPTETAPPDAAVAVLDPAQAARTALSSARLGLEDRSPTAIPVVSDRPPMRLARQIRDQMLSFYTPALELIADLENNARYLSQLAPLLPQLENLDETLGRPRSAGDIRRATAAADPIANRLIADLRALSPPDEVGPVHQQLLGVARQIRRDVERLREVAPQGRSPVVDALLAAIRDQIGIFGDTVETAPTTAQELGLSRRVEELDAQAADIAAALEQLAAEHDVDGLTIPGPSA